MYYDTVRNTHDQLKRKVIVLKKFLRTPPEELIVQICRFWTFLTSSSGRVLTVFMRTTTSSKIIHIHDFIIVYTLNSQKNTKITFLDLSNFPLSERYAIFTFKMFFIFKSQGQTLFFLDSQQKKLVFSISAAVLL